MVRITKENGEVIEHLGGVEMRKHGVYVQSESMTYTFDELKRVELELDVTAEMKKAAEDFLFLMSDSRL